MRSKAKNHKLCIKWMGRRQGHSIIGLLFTGGRTSPRTLYFSRSCSPDLHILAFANVMWLLSVVSKSFNVLCEISTLPCRQLVWYVFDQRMYAKEKTLHLKNLQRMLWSLPQQSFSLCVSKSTFLHMIHCPYTRARSVLKSFNVRNQSLWGGRGGQTYKSRAVRGESVLK